MWNSRSSNQVSCHRCRRNSCQLDLQKRLETVDLKKGEDLKAWGCSIHSFFFARILRDDFHWFAKNAVPEAQAPIATRAGGSREGPELVLRPTSLTSSISILTSSCFCGGGGRRHFHQYVAYTVTLREICPCGKSQQRLQAQKDLQMANGEGSGQSEAEC